MKFETLVCCLLGLLFFVVVVIGVLSGRDAKQGCTASQGLLVKEYGGGWVCIQRNGK